MMLVDKKWKQFRFDELFIKKTMKGYPKDAEDLTECIDGYHIYGQNIKYQYPQKVKLDDKYLHIINPEYPILAYTSSVGEIGMITESFYRSGDNGAFQGLFPKKHKFNRTELLFILTVMHLKFAEYGYSTSMANVMNFCVPLPVDANNEPDWIWMNGYMKSLETGLNDEMNDIMKIAEGDDDVIKLFLDKIDINDFKSWVTDNANMDIKNQMDLNNVMWKEFEVQKLFTISKVYGKKISDYESGEIPYVSGTKVNNGITGWIDAPEEDVSEGNCIAIDPITSLCTYQAKDFVGRGFSGASINLLYGEGLNKDRAYFVITSIQQNASKYSYARLLNGDKLANLKIWLPATAIGDPDWNWIEQYIRSLPYSDK